MVRKAFLMVMVLGSVGVGAEEKPLDGRFWQQLEPISQEFFLAGFSSCAGFHKSEIPLFSVASEEPVVEAVSRFYAASETRLSTPLKDVIFAVSVYFGLDTRDDLPLKGPGEQGPPGEFWGEYGSADAPLPAMFVRGFLECYRHVVGGKAQFPCPPEWYVSVLNEFYGLPPQDPENPGLVLPTKNLHVRVPEALERLGVEVQPPGAQASEALCGSAELSPQQRKK
ncbi:MAG: hypothetical protein ACP5NF_11765 [Thermoanaerobaculum sp.]